MLAAERTPTPRSRRGRFTPAILGGSALLLALVLAMLLLPVRSVVEVSTNDGVAGHISGDGPIWLSYVHSIDKLPIEEEITLDGGEFVVKSTRVQQFGAGMGYASTDGRGYSDGDWWVVDDLDRSIGAELLIRVGPEGIDHRLTAGEQAVDLTSCWPSERVRLEATRISFADIWFGPELPTSCEA